MRDGPESKSPGRFFMFFVLHDPAGHFPASIWRRTAFSSSSFPSGERSTSKTAARRLSWNFLLFKNASNILPCSTAAAVGFLGRGAGAAGAGDAPEIH